MELSPSTAGLKTVIRTVSVGGKGRKQVEDQRTQHNMSRPGETAAQRLERDQGKESGSQDHVHALRRATRQPTGICPTPKKEGIPTEAKRYP